MKTPLLTALIALLAGAALAGDAVIENATAQKSGDAWRFNVTIRHGDTGWDHYADAWRVVGADGEIYGVRTLLHPHETEQPFTRSLSGVALPEGLASVWVEARDSVHGWNAEKFEVSLGR